MYEALLDHVFGLTEVKPLKQILDYVGARLVPHETAYAGACIGCGVSGCGGGCYASCFCDHHGCVATYHYTVHWYEMYGHSDCSGCPSCDALCGTYYQNVGGCPQP